MQGTGTVTKRETAVWDLPVRLTHWSFLTLVVVLLASGKLGHMDVHAKAGYAVLALAVFRWAWGLVGSAHARFSDFLHGPRTVAAYALAFARGRAPRHLGHNPLGGWMVMTLLVVLTVQAALGLFANDDILFEGPLAYLVSSSASAMLTGLHKLLFKALLALVAIHVLGVVLHGVIERENLVIPMLTGRKRTQ